MPWSTPTLGELRRLNRDNLAAFLPGADASVPNSVLRVLSDSNAGLAALTLQYLDWLSRQLMVDTAEAEWLDRFGQIWLGGRKAAEFATGSARLTGISGTVVPAGTRLATGNSGAEIETTESVTLGDVTVEVVPANKTLIFKAFAYFGEYNLSINAVNMARVSNALPLGPFTAGAGDVIAINGAGGGGFSGFLYDA